MINTPLNHLKPRLQHDHITRVPWPRRLPRGVRAGASLRSIAAALVLTSAGSAWSAMTSESTPSSPQLGVNVEGLSDWARMPVFVDLMKASRAWGSVRTPWVHDVSVDADGWPTEDAGVVVRVLPGETDLPATVRYMKAGVYALSFRGKANVKPVTTSGVAIRNLRHDAGTDLSTAEVVIGSTTSELMLGFTQSQGGVRNVQLHPPGHVPGQTFTSEFLRAIQPFGVLRLMDLLSINNSPVALWEDRARPGSASQAGRKGMAWEHAVEIANQTGKDIWINIPVHALDAYIESLAKLLKSSLDPARVVYVEYSNELWNPMFTQTHDNGKAAIDESVAGDVTLTRGEPCTRAHFEARKGNCNAAWAGYLRIGKRSVRISEIFAEVFGRESINKRIRVVLATQYANRAIAEQVLKNIAQYHGKPSSFLYAIASAPYFYLDSRLSNRPGLRPDEVLESLQQSLERDTLPYMAAGRGPRHFRKGEIYQDGNWTGASQKALADYYGLRSLAYEGGPDLLQGTNNLNSKSRANADDRLGALVERMLMQWYGCGNDLFMYFTLASTNGRYGYWGLTDDPSNLDTPKFKAIRRVMQSRPDPADCR